MNIILDELIERFVNRTIVVIETAVIFLNIVSNITIEPSDPTLHYMTLIGE
jgi:hypothetical protein